MKETYCETIRLIERLHRLFLKVVKVALDRTGIADIDNIQALILSNIGKEELTVAKGARGLRSDYRIAQTSLHSACGQSAFRRAGGYQWNADITGRFLV